MGLFRRALQWVKSLVTESPREPTYEPRDTGDSQHTPTPTPESDLPPGWSFAALYYASQDPSNRRVINRDPSDYDISTADAIIVQYTDALGTIHRTIHGAADRKQVGKLIARTIMIVSPPR